MCRGYCKTAQRGKIHQAQNNIAYFMAHYENTRARLECAGGYVSRGGGVQKFALNLHKNVLENVHNMATLSPMLPFYGSLLQTLKTAGNV